MPLQLSPVEGPDDTFAWDTRIRKLAACCRHANTAPVSFYGLRKVCDVDPLSWEDRDIIRLEIKQLVDSFENVCGSLRSTDELLVAGKRLEREQIRALAGSFSQARDEIDLKDAALVSAAKKGKALETEMLREKFGRLSAEEEKTEAMGAYMSNHRIFSAMESVVLHTKLDSDAAHGQTITSLKEDLVGAMKYIVELRADKSAVQKSFDAFKAESEALLQAKEAELNQTLDSLRKEEAAHERHKEEWAAAEATLERTLADTRRMLEQREDDLETLGQALEEEQRRAAEDQASAEREMRKMLEQRDQLQRDSAAVVQSYKKQVAELNGNIGALARELESTSDTLQQTEVALKKKREEYTQLEQAAEEETRRLNGNYLRAKGDLREAQEDLEDQRVEAQVASDAAKKKELGLLDLLEETRREVAKAREGERIAGQRLEKALLNRATAIVESQAERSLREATETSRVFDSVHYDAALAQQERQEVGRVLDNAASRLRYR